MTRKRVGYWALWEVVLPFVMIAVWWPMGELLKVQHPFEKTFSSGELVIFAGLLVLGLRSRFRSTESFAVEVILVCALLAFSWFGFIKAMTINEAAFGSQAEMMATFWHVNIGLVVLAVALGIYVHVREAE